MDELLSESACENAVRWIDTSCMIVDCLTKKMDAELLIRLMRAGRLNLQPTIASEMAKLKKQKQRKLKKLEEKAQKEAV